jgi:hypothetical protein
VRRLGERGLAAMAIETTARDTMVVQMVGPARAAKSSAQNCIAAAAQVDVVRSGKDDEMSEMRCVFREQT